MKMNAPDIRNHDGTTYNSENDTRLTKIGKLIRKTSIDEIPQILNVIKGDMSFVGPRPDMPDAIDLYGDEFIRKLNLRPGITGLNQAYFRNSADLETRFKNDVFYVDNYSFSIDIKIIFKTIQAVFKRKNVFK
jgi:lipopolysaccharide/colanic/teichoic acid biosynthesis glycosyltransferase